jgi:hypothetical protein
MTQLNLLPDVKIEFLKATRQKRLVVVGSLLVAAVSLAVLLMLVSVVYVFQKKNVADMNADIKTYSAQLARMPDLDKVLTVQNQLNTLPTLHQQRPTASRLFGFLTQLTPTSASISQYDANFKDRVMTITGTAASLDVANTFIDTLKFTTYKKVDATTTAGIDSANDPKAFSDVVLSQFTRSATTANYTITLSFDPNIFDGSSTIRLAVPHIISTRSATEQPTDLFQQAPQAKKT